MYKLLDGRISPGVWGTSKQIEKSRREQGNINMFEGIRELLKRRLVSLTGDVYGGLRF